MAAAKKNDIASIFLLVAVLLAVAAAFVALWKPLRASTSKGKAIGLLGIAFLVAAVAFLAEPGAAASPFVGMLPDPWIKALIEHNVIAGLLAGFLFLVLYLTGIGMKQPVAPCGARLVAALRQHAPDRVERLVESIGAALSDGRIDDATEGEPLTREVANLLSESGEASAPGACAAALTELTREAFSRTLAGAQEDSVISQSERDHLLAFSMAFPDLFPRAGMEDVLRSAESTCALRSGRLPEVEAPGILMKYREEKCHFVVRDVELCFEQTESLGYRGGSVGTTVRAGGLPIRVGVHGGSVRKRTAVKTDDTGTLFVTSRRLVFVGTTKSTTVAVDKIVQVEATSDPPVLTVVAEGPRTKNLFFCTGEAETLAAGIRAIVEQRAV